MSLSEKNEVGKVVQLSPALPSQAWRALREAARALEAAADAMLGNRVSLPTASQSVLWSADPSQTVVQTVNDFLLAKARAGKSDRYLRQLRVSLTDFCKGRALRPVTSVTTLEIENWLDQSDWKTVTQRGYLSDVRTMFNFAIRRNLVSHNPAAAVELPTIEPSQPPGIHSPGQVIIVLEKARRLNLDVMRHLAIRYFAGLRTSEAHRVTEENILLDRGVIEVPAAKSKTRRRRLVTIQANLKFWLALGGELRPMSPSKTVRPVIRASKVDWPHNVTRHSFVSYHVAHFQNAARTALEAGHTEQMLFSNYRELVTPKDAAEFWAIVPRPGP